ncbi:MAG: Card1-like endonuclease domain-containing protein [Halochromatium sp.]
MSTQVVLVSDQVLQNLIPILMERPTRVCLVLTEAMTRRGADRRLAAQLRGVEAQLIRCERCPDSGFPQIRAFAHQVAETLLNAGADTEIVLNATGGTKLMSLAFVEVFRGLASRILYTDTAHRRIEYLANSAQDGPASIPTPTPMSNVLDVPAYLRAQGFQFQRAVSEDPRWTTLAAARKAACKFLGRRIADPSLQQLIGTLNYLADKALERLPDSRDERLAAPVQSFPRPPRGLWSEAMAQLAAAEVLAWEPGSAYFRFTDLAAAQFVRGGWLEDYAYHAVHDAGVHDARLGVEGHWDRQEAMANEFDVLACHMNQLLHIECKTLRYRDENDNAIAYKLDSLGDDVRGLFGHTWLLSAREPTETLIARARRARIRLVPPGELQHLRDLVREWRG